jgi:hypothetical protein
VVREGGISGGKTTSPSLLRSNDHLVDSFGNVGLEHQRLLDFVETENRKEERGKARKTVQVRSRCIAGKEETRANRVLGS